MVHFKNYKQMFIVCNLSCPLKDRGKVSIYFETISNIYEMNDLKLIHYIR